MRTKFLVLFLLAVSSVIILPMEGSAKTADSKTTVEITKTEPVAQRRYRNYQRRQNNRYYRQAIRRNNRQIRRDNRRARMIRQYYYRNGRRYSRMIRVY